MSEEQDRFDARRRQIAEMLVKAVGTEMKEEADPAAWVGGMILAAAVLGFHYQLGDVFELVAEDMQRDMTALESGEWRPGGEV